MQDKEFIQYRYVKPFPFKTFQDQRDFVQNELLSIIIIIEADHRGWLLSNFPLLLEQAFQKCYGKPFLSHSQSRGLFQMNSIPGAGTGLDWLQPIRVLHTLVIVTGSGMRTWSSWRQCVGRQYGPPGEGSFLPLLKQLWEMASSPYV